MAFVNMLGVIAGSLGIISFGLDRFGGEGSHSGSTIKVAVALDGPQLSNSAGDLPDVYVSIDIPPLPNCGIMQLTPL